MVLKIKKNTIFLFSCSLDSQNDTISNGGETYDDRLTRALDGLMAGVGLDSIVGDDFYEYYNRFYIRDRRGIEYNYHANNEAVDGDNINFNDGLSNYRTHNDDGHNGIADGYTFSDPEEDIDFHDIDDEYTVSDPEEELDIHEDVDEDDDGYYPDRDVIEPFGDLHYSTLLLHSSNRQSFRVILKQPFKELKENKKHVSSAFLSSPSPFLIFSQMVV